MREVSFRGKRTDNGEWIEGWFVGKVNKTIFSPAEDSAQIIDNDLYWHEVIPETIGQYTGLGGKNGKKIFEGDVINIEYLDTIVHNAVVRYVGAEFYGVNDFDFWELDEYVSIEVIGNIHDNPELLKGGEADA